MKIKIILLVFLNVALCQGCISTSYKIYLKKSGESKEIIDNAILDFSYTSHAFKKDSVFFISYESEYYRLGYEREASGILQTVRKNFFPRVSTVSISSNYNKYLLTSFAVIGSTNSKLPTRFVEKDGKLFYWIDREYPLTKEALATLKKFNLLVDDENGTIKYLDFATDDGQKGVDYYFCRQNLSRYKKIVTSIGLGYYDPPNIKCGTN